MRLIINRNKIVRWLFGVLVFFTNLAEAGSQENYEVQQATLSDSTRINKTRITTKKTPFWQRAWFMKYQATMSKVIRVVNFIMIIVAACCILFVFYLIAKFALLLL